MSDEIDYAGLQERKDRLVKQIITSSEDLMKWKTYEDSGLNGVFPPYFREISADNPKSAPFSWVQRGLQSYLMRNIKAELGDKFEIKGYWYVTFFEYLDEHKDGLGDIFEYATDYAVIGLKLHEIERSHHSDGFYDALNDALKEAQYEQD